MLLAIDPGPERSAWLVYDLQNRKPVAFGIEHNGALQEAVISHMNIRESQILDHLVIEMVQCYGSGLAVGKETYDTCIWIGRFIERFRDLPHSLVMRPHVRAAICGTGRAKDANVRQALIDRWGGQRLAIGTRHCVDCKGKGWRRHSTPAGVYKEPCATCHETGDGRGPLYGITSHVWAALAVAVTWAKEHGGQPS